MRICSIDFYSRAVSSLGSQQPSSRESAEYLTQVCALVTLACRKSMAHQEVDIGGRLLGLAPAAISRNTRNFRRQVAASTMLSLFPCLLSKISQLTCLAEPTARDQSSNYLPCSNFSA